MTEPTHHDIHKAIRRDRKALARRPPGDHGRYKSLNDLATSLWAHFKRTRREKDLDEAIELWDEALALEIPGRVLNRSSLDNLAFGLRTRFEESGRLQDLEEAIDLNREALSLRPYGHPFRSNTLNQLADALCIRFKQTGKLEDLEESIDCGGEALFDDPLGDSNRASCPSTLANVLHCRYDYIGQLQDLEESIKLNREALSLQHPGDVYRSYSLFTLANVLRSRFMQTNRAQDLEEAIELYREALSLHTPDHSGCIQFLNNLACSLEIRSQQTGRLQDLEEAIEMHRAALSLPLGHSPRSTSLINLGASLYYRFQTTGQLHDLEEAIKLVNEALSLLPLDHHSRSGKLYNLAILLQSLFKQTGQLQDIEEAVEYHREALVTLPYGSSMHISCLAGLSRALLARFQAISEEDDLNEAFHMFAIATESQFTDVREQLSAAQSWVRSAREFQHDSLLSAHVQCLALLQRGLAISPSLEMQWNTLTRNSSSLAVDAASSAIDKGQLNVAIEMLEQGRALLWSKMKGYRQPVLELRAINPALADKFETVSDELEHLATSRSRLEDDVSKRVPRFTTAWDDQWRKQRVLSDEWNEIVEYIRQIDGFSDFLQPVPFGRLKRAAAEGPVIIVNVSSYRSDALVLRDDTSDPTLVRLANSVFDEVGNLSEVLGQARRRGDNTTLAAVMQDVLRTLWKLIAQPVVDQLRTLGVAENSRIWWCPTGKLCSLPLHAAQPLITGERGLLDLYVSSYTPTLSSLITARENIPARRDDYPQLLTVGQSDDSLRWVDAELEEIRKLGNFVDTIIEKQATPDAVLENLQTHPWAHFACHGHLDDEQPFKSSFKLYEGSRLTVMDILQSRLPNAEFAFLSACHSAAGDFFHTPDEVLHLAAAMQFCGFRSVVGTLWAMADDDGPVLSREFYKYMFRHNDLTKVDFKDSAVALSFGIKLLRNAKVPTHRWAAFVHIGA